MNRWWLAVMACAILMASCSGSAGPSALPAASPVATVEPTPEIKPGPSSTAHPGGGRPDPAGRIAFGSITRDDSFFGQVVALWAIDPDGSDLIQLNDGESGFPAWSPDGSRLAFTQKQPDGTWQIATMAADGSDVKVLTTGLGADGATWSPDGAWLAYSRGMTAIDDQDFHTTIWRMNADGSGAAPLGDQSLFDIEPRISPDGTSVLFERLSFPSGEQRQELIVRILATGAERVVLGAEHGVEHATWSRDGAWIVYDTNPNYGGAAPNDQVERIATDAGGEPEILFEGTSDQGGFKPTYSPTGDRIVFGCFRGGQSATDAACLMNADGSGFEYLIDDPTAHENHFSWGPPTPD